MQKLDRTGKKGKKGKKRQSTIRNATMAGVVKDATTRVARGGMMLNARSNRKLQQ